MMKHLLGLGVAALLFAAGCGNGGNTGAGGAGSTSNGTGASGSGSTSASSGSTSTSGSASSSGSGSSSSGGSGAVTAQELLAKVAACNPWPGMPIYRTDDMVPKTIPICQLNGAAWWRADMDIDCDGGQSAICKGDMSYQKDTSVTDSMGSALDASILPYVVVPQSGNGFDYTTAKLPLGSVIAVIYNGQLEYGVFGDEGPPDIIGEASYAMAGLFGIPNDPNNGGVDCTNNGTKCPITYIAFTGNHVLTKNEDHAEAISLGDARAKQLLLDNP